MSDRHVPFGEMQQEIARLRTELAAAELRAKAAEQALEICRELSEILRVKISQLQRK